MSDSIRLATEDDAAEVLRIYEPIVRATAISFELHPPGVEEIRERIRAVLLSHAWLVCGDGQRIAGYAYASRFRAREAYQWTTEVTVYVDAEQRRRGIGRALYVSLLEVLKLQGFLTAIAVIALPNEPSVQLHERLGFRAVGVLKRVGYKLGRWHDVGWWQMELREREADPQSTRRVAELAGTAEWRRAVAAGLTELA